VRHHGDRGDEPQFLGLGGDKGDAGQLLVPATAGAAGKLAGVRIGVFLVDVARHHDMVADCAIIVAHGLAAADDAGEVARPRQKSNDRRCKPELHCILRQEGASVIT